MQIKKQNYFLFLLIAISIIAAFLTEVILLQRVSNPIEKGIGPYSYEKLAVVFFIFAIILLETRRFVLAIKEKGQSEKNFGRPIWALILLILFSVDSVILTLWQNVHLLRTDSILLIRAEPFLVFLGVYIFLKILELLYFDTLAFVKRFPKEKSSSHLLFSIFVYMVFALFIGNLFFRNEDSALFITNGLYFRSNYQFLPKFIVSSTQLITKFDIKSIFIYFFWIPSFVMAYFIVMLGRKWKKPIINWVYSIPKIPQLDIGFLKILDRPQYFWGITLLLSVLFFLFAKPKFETNDDIAMMLFSSGGYDGMSTSFLIFTHSVIGYLLKWFYTTFPSFNWFLVYEYLVLFTSLFLLLLVFRINRVKSKIAISIYCILFLAFFFHFIWNLAFTTVSFTAFTAGFALVTTNNKKHRVVTLGIGLIFLCLAGLIRRDSFFLAWFLMLPLILVFSLASRKVLTLVVYAISLIFVFVSWKIDAVRYDDSPEWKSYSEFNLIRGQIHDTPRMNVFPEGQEGIPYFWSNNDIRMFNSWLFGDPVKYSYENLSHYFSDVKQTRRSFESTSNYLAASLGEYSFYIFIPVICFILFAKRVKVGSRRFLLGYLATTCFSIGVVIYLGIAERLPVHIILPVIMLNVFSIYFLEIQVKSFNLSAGIQKRTLIRLPDSVEKLATYILITMMFINLVSLFIGNHQNSIRLANYSKITGRIVKSLHPYEENYLLIVPGNEIPLDWLSPIRSWNPVLNIFWQGWMTFSPPYMNRLHAEGAASIFDLLLKENVFIATNLPQYVSTYFEENYADPICSEKVYAEEISEFDSNRNSIQIYKFKRCPIN